MTDRKMKWNPPGWPWELEMVTLAFFLIALLAPMYIDQSVPDSVEELRKAVATTGIAAGRDSLSTQFGFLLSAGLVALYILHLAFAATEINRVTASPLHLISPAVFSMMAYYRILQTPKYERSIFYFMDGSVLQIALFLGGVLLLMAVLTWIRRYRYMADFDDIKWDLVAPAKYDLSYLSMILQLRPLLYPPRHYRVCPEGLVIEGWFYAMPIGFNDIHSLSRISGTGMLNTGHYYASTCRGLLRMELHDSRNAVYISPSNLDEFIKYCSQHIARRKASGKATPTKHGLLHASDTHHGSHAGTTAGTASGTKSGTATTDHTTGNHVPPS